ncbi:hypothetical protein ONZ51_g7462 [Trametes cubensis]|uniref:Cytochrome P450 n=1 Tax=Trametes cubensis TaxID=1111947 RepID=A0AAD7TQJ2_9APHY|nr:hypothetical protein ONZ51_g7462 [Trametes cubensis]
MAPTDNSLMLLLAALMITTLVVAHVRSFLEWRTRTRGRPLPPGPRPWPIIGNLFDLPRFKPWHKCLAFTEKYGSVVYLQVLGKPIIIVGDPDVANELLNRRSANTADRPRNPVVELSGQEVNFAVLPYGEWWRRHRRAFWHHFNPGVISRYLSIQREGAHKFLASVLTSPYGMKTNIYFTFQSVILKIVYGIDVVDASDSRLAIASAALECISQATPGHFAVELLPFLRHVPAWFPGAGFQKELAMSKIANYRLKNDLFHEIKVAFDRGEHRPCVAANMLVRAQESTLSFDEEEVIKHICVIAVEGSADTTGHTLEAFCLAMALYPNVQKKAQAELDQVVGPDRLPDHTDSNSLVYINAIVKEALRWHVVLPQGIPHRTIEDDELNGYFIPRGTTVMANVWAFLHDPQAYENPFDFFPERFIRDGGIDPNVRDPTDFMFGFGRRICPGRHFAIPSLFINIASLLHVFDISLPLDDNGHPISIEYQESHGLTRSGHIHMYCYIFDFLTERTLL